MLYLYTDYFTYFNCKTQNIAKNEMTYYKIFTLFNEFSRTILLVHYRL